MKHTPRLLFAQEVSGHLARIWEYEDGRFLFDWLQSSGKGISVFCGSFRDAVRLWDGFRKDLEMEASLPELPSDVGVAT